MSVLPILDACYAASIAQLRDTAAYPVAFLLHPSLLPALECEVKSVATLVTLASAELLCMGDKGRWRLFGIPVEFSLVGAKIGLRTRGGDVLVVECAAGVKTKHE